MYSSTYEYYYFTLSVRTHTRRIRVFVQKYET